MSATRQIDTPHFVYELRNSDGVLLYVGITLNLGKRMSDHARAKQWWEHVADVRATLYPSREAAQQVELVAKDDPAFNVEGHPFKAQRKTYTWSLQSLKPRDPLPPDHLLDLEAMATWMRYVVTTTKGYYRRGQLPPPDAMRGKTPLWRVATIDEWDARRKGLTADYDLPA